MMKGGCLMSTYQAPEITAIANEDKADALSQCGCAC